jgi:hypothetical protein
LKCYKDTALSHAGQLYTTTADALQWISAIPGQQPGHTAVTPMFCRRLFPTREIMQTYVNEGWFHESFVEIGEEEARVLDGELVAYTVVAAAEATIISRQHKTPVMKAPGFYPYHALCHGHTFGVEQTSRILSGSITQHGYTAFRVLDAAEYRLSEETCSGCDGKLSEPPGCRTF